MAGTAPPRSAPWCGKAVAETPRSLRWVLPSTGPLPLCATEAVGASRSWRGSDGEHGMVGGGRAHTQRESQPQVNMQHTERRGMPA